MLFITTMFNLKIKWCHSKYLEQHLSPKLVLDAVVHPPQSGFIEGATLVLPPELATVTKPLRTMIHYVDNTLISLLCVCVCVCVCAWVCVCVCVCSTYHWLRSNWYSWHSDTRMFVSINSCWRILGLRRLSRVGAALGDATAASLYLMTLNYGKLLITLHY